jgi:hypothetical protein
MFQSFRCIRMISFRRLTSADHSDVFIILKVVPNQTLYSRILRECLSSLQAARDDQQIEFVLG